LLFVQANKMKPRFFAWLLMLLFIAPTYAQTKTWTQQVLLPGGKPAVGAKITLQWTEVIAHKGITRQNTTATNTEGKFSFELPVERATGQILSVNAPGCAFAIRSRWSGGDKPLQLLPDVPISGQVVGANKQGVAGAQVVMTQLGFFGYAPFRVQSLNHVTVPQLTCRSDKEGAFRMRSAEFDGLMGNQVFWGSAASNAQTQMGFWAETNEERQSNPAIVISLAPTVSLRGKVVDSQTNQPLANAQIGLFNRVYKAEQIGWDETTQTDENGRFEFKDQPSQGEGTLSVRHPQYQNALTEMQLDFSISRDTFGHELVLPLHRVARITGQIVDAETGKPLPGDLSVWVAAKWSQKTDFGSDVTASGEAQAYPEFVFSAPIGTVSLELTGISAWGAESDRRVIMPHRALFQVPPAGLNGVTLKVKVQPTYIVKLKKEGTDNWKTVYFHKRTAQGEVGIGNGDTRSPLLFAAQGWGEDMEVRGTSEDGKEVFGWTKITASRDLSPNAITF